MQTTEPTLASLLRSDLTRHFHFNGQPGRLARNRDLWRNFLHPRCAPISLYRLAHYLQARRGGRAFAKLLTWLNFFFFGIEIDSRCVIGPGCYIPHSMGTVIGAQSIGAQALIYHQVTLGARVVQHEHKGRPVIGDNVILGSGAKVLGDIHIGDSVTVGPNSVVMESLPDRVTVLGIPAKIIRSKNGDAHV